MTLMGQSEQWWHSRRHCVRVLDIVTFVVSVVAVVGGAAGAAGVFGQWKSSSVGAAVSVLGRRTSHSLPDIPMQCP